jgi:hypothetical protein
MKIKRWNSVIKYDLINLLNNNYCLVDFNQNNIKEVLDLRG